MINASSTRTGSFCGSLPTIRSFHSTLVISLKLPEFTVDKACDKPFSRLVAGYEQLCPRTTRNVLLVSFFIGAGNWK